MLSISDDGLPDSNGPWVRIKHLTINTKVKYGDRVCLLKMPVPQLVTGESVDDEPGFVINGFADHPMSDILGSIKNHREKGFTATVSLWRLYKDKVTKDSPANRRIYVPSLHANPVPLP